jgi:hypothetical protein
MEAHKALLSRTKHGCMNAPLIGPISTLSKCHILSWDKNTKGKIHLSKRQPLYHLDLCDSYLHSVAAERIEIWFVQRKWVEFAANDLDFAQ